MSMTSSQKQNETKVVMNSMEEKKNVKPRKNCIYKEGKCVSIY